MICQALGRMKYEVSSRRGAPSLTVDLGSLMHRGLCNGKCDCEEFAMNIFPVIRELRRRDLMKWEGSVQVVARKGVLTFGEPGKLFRWFPCDEFRCAHILAADKFQYEQHKGVMSAAIRKQFNDYDRDQEWE